MGIIWDFWLSFFFTLFVEKGAAGKREGGERQRERRREGGGVVGGEGGEGEGDGEGEEERERACTMLHMWRSEDSLQKSVLSHHVGLRDQTQTGRLGSKLPHALNHLTCPASVVKTHIFST